MGRLISPAGFAKLPMSEKAVRVAKDVIAQLESEVYKAAHIYVQVKRSDSLRTIAKSKPAREVLLEGNVECSVCARGAAFLSSVKFKNELKVRDLDNNSFRNPIQWDHYLSESAATDKSTRFLLDVFHAFTQELVEDVYESNEPDYDDEYGGFVLMEAVSRYNDDLDEQGEAYIRDLDRKAGVDVDDEFYQTYESHPHWIKQRMIIVMKNIIKNNGAFVIPKKYFFYPADYVKHRRFMKSLVN